MFWLSDAIEHKKLEEKLLASDWFRGLMENEEFRAAYEKKYAVRLRLADTRYLRQLLESEDTRMDFVNDVLRKDDIQEK